MDAREQLRRYLEQRRELGESEFVLDGLSVDAAMRALGAMGTVGSPADWRAALAQAGATPAAPAAPAKPAPALPESPPASSSMPPAGIVIGSATRDLLAPNGPQYQSLDEIAKAVSTCKACGLYKTATNPVPGEGNPHAKLVVVGEAPGAKEDETGKPFVGQAGQLLTKILAAIQLAREDVFICNVLKHRPPGNRNPLPEEVVACRPFLVRQIELIAPSVILAMGTFAAQTLLESRLPLGKLRGQVHRYHGVPLIVTYHPAALLRNPSWKRPTWEDVQLARRILDDSSARG